MRPLKGASMSKEKRDFDKVAATWDENPRRVEQAAAIARAMLERVPFKPGWHIADYGAGTGLLTLNILLHVGRITAFDSSAGMLDVLKGKLAKADLHTVECRLLDLETDSTQSGRYDAVVSAMTLHHIKEPGEMIRKWAAMLVPGGWLAVADLESEEGDFHDDPTGIFHFGFVRKSLEDWFSGAGLKIQAMDIAYVVHKDVKGQAKDFPILLAVARKSDAW